MPNTGIPKVIVEGMGHAIGKGFANELGHSHTGDNNQMYVVPDVPPTVGPTLPVDDPYKNFRVETT